jgi:hypothetical protein
VSESKGLVTTRQLRRDWAKIASAYARIVRDIGIASHREPEVSRGDGSGSLYVTFRGTSDARSSVDRDTRLRIVLPVAQAARLWHLLDAVLTDQEKMQRAD